MSRKPQASHLSAPCPRCGTVGSPLLSPGKGPHAIRASCGHCGRFLTWISVLAPSERVAHLTVARLRAMRKQAALGAPETLAQARARSEALKTATEARRSNAPEGKLWGIVSAGDEPG